MPTHDSSRFFHTLVVLGAALGAGCGGALDAPPDDDASATGGSAAGGSPAAAGGSSGGALPTGGGSGGQGEIDIDTGPPWEWPFVTGCRTEQQSCVTVSCDLPSGPCTCDSERPTKADDCANDHDFVCRAERMQVGDIDAEVRFGCACVPREAACECLHSDTMTGCDPWVASPREILCGGCLVILK